MGWRSSYRRGKGSYQGRTITRVRYEWLLYIPLIGCSLLWWWWSGKIRQRFFGSTKESGGDRGDSNGKIYHPYFLAERCQKLYACGIWRAYVRGSYDLRLQFGWIRENLNWSGFTPIIDEFCSIFSLRMIFINSFFSLVIKNLDSQVTTPGLKESFKKRDRFST